MYIRAIISRTMQIKTIRTERERERKIYIYRERERGRERESVI